MGERSFMACLSVPVTSYFHIRAPLPRPLPITYSSPAVHIEYCLPRRLIRHVPSASPAGTSTRRLATSASRGAGTSRVMLRGKFRGTSGFDRGEEDPPLIWILSRMSRPTPLFWALLLLLLTLLLRPRRAAAMPPSAPPFSSSSPAPGEWHNWLKDSMTQSGALAKRSRW